MKKFSKYLFILFIIGFLALIAAFPSLSIQSAGKGIQLWLNVVLPSLLPFFVATSLLMQTGFVRVIGSALSPVVSRLFGCPGESGYVFLASALSGYPMGAKLCAELTLNGDMDRKVAQRTLCFTSMSGPLFISGTVAIGMFNCPELSVYLLATHYLAAILTGILLNLILKPVQMKKDSVKDSFSKSYAFFRHHNPYFSRQVGDILNTAVTNSILTLLTVGGFIVIFNVLIQLFSEMGVFRLLTELFSPLLQLIGIDKNAVFPAVSGLLEMTTGCQLAATSIESISVKALVAAFLIGFGGCSILAQTFAVISKAQLDTKLFLFSKLLQAVLSCLLLYAALCLFPLNFAAATRPDYHIPNWYSYIGVATLAVSLAIFAYFLLLRARRRRQLKLR